MFDVWSPAGLCLSNQCVAKCWQHLSYSGDRITGAEYRVLVGDTLDHHPPRDQHRTQRLRQRLQLSHVWWRIRHTTQRQRNPVANAICSKSPFGYWCLCFLKSGAKKRIKGEYCHIPGGFTDSGDSVRTQMVKWILQNLFLALNTWTIKG